MRKPSTLPRDGAEVRALVASEAAAAAPGAPALVPSATTTTTTRTRRALTVGASVAMLTAAGAALGYAATAHGAGALAVGADTASLESHAFVMPTSDDIDEDDEGGGDDVPPFADFDKNGDGAISNAEYTGHLALLRDLAIARVEKSTLPAATKTDFVARLRANFAKEANCATRLANRDRGNNGAVSEDRFPVFYTMLKEFCHVDDPVIPDEFEPTETPPPPPTAPPPPPLAEGQAVKCSPSDAAIFRYTDGQIRWYPNPPIAASWDANWFQPVVVDCSALKRGPDMAIKMPSPDGLPDGQAIKCDPNQPEVYRLESGQRRWYPNPAIADSWDPNWGAFVVVDCSALPRGDDMGFRPADLSGLRDGQAVKCDANRPDVYRYTGGEVRWYPNPAIADSWDPNWTSFVVIDCRNVPRGGDMAMKNAGKDAWKKIDGWLTQLSFDGKTLCGVNGVDAIYCATKNIRGEGATQWRHIPGRLIHVDVYGDSLWGVNRQNDIYYGSAVGKPNWLKVPGWLKMVASDGKQVCGVNGNDDIFCGDATTPTNPNWRQVPGKLSYVDVLDGRLVGANSHGEIFSGHAYGDPQWVQLGGNLRQVAFDGVNLCGTNSQDDVWCADSGLLGSPNWGLVDGKMRHVAVDSGELFAVDQNGGIYYRAH